MENIDIQQIESYLRDKMTPEVRLQFESAMAHDPELARRTEEMRRFAEAVRQVGREDNRKQVEAVSNKIRREEWYRKMLPMMLGGLLLAGLFWLGYVYYNGRNRPPQQHDQTPFQTTIPDTTKFAEKQNDQPNDTVGETYKGKPYTVEVTPVDAAGNLSARKIQVQMFRDTTTRVILYIFTDNGKLLKFYLPAGKELPRPPQLIERNRQVFIRMPDGSERNLQETVTARPL